MKKIRWSPSWTDNYGTAKIGSITICYHQTGVQGWTASAHFCNCEPYFCKCKLTSIKGPKKKSILEVREDAVRLTHALISDIEDKITKAKGLLP